MKILKSQIVKITLITFSLSSCTSSKTQPPEFGQQPPPQSAIASTVTCPKKKDCNIDNYKEHIYSPGVQCDLSCIKVSGVNTTKWSWDNIPSKYSKGCDALQDVQLVSTFFVCANLVGLNWSKKDLTDSDLSGANLAYANLQGAILTKTNMKEAVVTGANLDTDLTTTELTGAIYNKDTKFPENFSPKSKKMINDNSDHSL